MPASRGMLTVAPSPSAPPRSEAAPVPGKNPQPYWCSDTYSTSGSSQKMASVPLPWCTSQSSTTTRSTPRRACVGRGDGDLVEQAEPHRPCRLGVMARRPAGAEGHRSVAVEHGVGGGHRAAAGVHGRVEAVRPDHRVGVDRPAAGRSQRRELLDECGVVHPLDGLRRRRRSVLGSPPRLAHRREHRVVARRLLGVRAGIVGPKELVQVHPIAGSL